MLCNTAAAASAFKDDDDSDYLQASISGKEKALKLTYNMFTLSLLITL